MSIMYKPYYLNIWLSISVIQKITEKGMTPPQAAGYQTDYINLIRSKLRGIYPSEIQDETVDEPQGELLG